MLADKYVFEQWDCPDTIQAAFRYPGFDVVYEGMMSSSIDDGGLEFRGTEATLKIDRSGFGVYREDVQDGQNPVLTEDSFRDGTIAHMQNFFECIKTRKEPNAPVETGVAARAQARSAIWLIAAAVRLRGRRRLRAEKSHWLVPGQAAGKSTLGN